RRDHVVTGLQSAGDIEDEPGVPAAMLTDRGAVDPYVGDGERPLELQLHPLPAPGRGNGEVLAVPAQAHVERPSAGRATHVVGRVEVMRQSHRPPRRVVETRALRPRHVRTQELPPPIEIDLLPGAG